MLVDMLASPKEKDVCILQLCSIGARQHGTPHMEDPHHHGEAKTDTVMDDHSPYSIGVRDSQPQAAGLDQVSGTAGTEPGGCCQLGSVG
jgi:hypothetical protein